MLAHTHIYLLFRIITDIWEFSYNQERIVCQEVFIFADLILYILLKILLINLICSLGERQLLQIS